LQLQKFSAGTLQLKELTAIFQLQEFTPCTLYISTTRVHTRDISARSSQLGYYSWLTHTRVYEAGGAHIRDIVAVGVHIRDLQLQNFSAATLQLQDLTL
jgi:hypothetical protein